MGQGSYVTARLLSLWRLVCAIFEWLASGALGVVEYHAEPVVQARWHL